jgi:hypothetical protein
MTRVMLEIIFLSYNYHTILALQSQPTIQLLIGKNNII